MGELNKLIKLLEAAAQNPAKTFRDSCERTGKEAVGCFPIFAPEELIYAAGFIPIGMWGGQTQIKLADRYLQGFCCSIMRANIEYGMKGTYDQLRAVTIPAFCDTLKCIIENWKVAVPQIPLIPIVYPQNRRIACGVDYMIDEFKRVCTELEKIRGNRIGEDELEEALFVYEAYRAAMRDFVKVAPGYLKTINAKTRHFIIKAGWFMDKSEYTDIIKKITAELLKMPPEEFYGIRAVTTGLLGEPVGILDVFVENDIAVVADDVSQESRQFRTLTRKEGSALERLAYRIADQRGDTFLYEEEKSRGEMLIQMAKSGKAQMVVSLMMKFCDPEEFDYPIYKAELEKANIPLLYLETEQRLDSIEQIRTRVQSFVEMLE